MDLFADVAMSLIIATTIILTWNDILQLDGHSKNNRSKEDDDAPKDHDEEPWKDHHLWRSLYDYPSKGRIKYLPDNITLCVNHYGDKLQYLCGRLHRDDGPAFIKADGSKRWYQHGNLHRDDGPAIISPSNGEEAWYINGDLHRDNGPAEITPSYKAWFYRGKRHRLYDLAYEHSNGYKVWYRHGKFHRVDGPAKDNLWYIDGDKLHPHEIKWYTSRRIRGIVIALTPLDLPQYVILWILEFSEKDYLYDQFSQKHLIAMIESIQLSCRSVLDTRS